MTAQTKRYRRAHAIVAFWDGGDFVFENYLTGKQTNLSPMIAQLLGELTELHSLAELRRLFVKIPDANQLIDSLLKADLLVVKGSAAAKFREPPTIKGHLLLLSLLGVVLLPIAASGQNLPRTATTPGTPAGSYQMGDDDAINLFTGNINYNLPLLSIGGRGDGLSQLGIVLEQQWTRYEVPAEGWPGYLQHQYVNRSPNPLAFVGSVRIDYTSVPQGDICNNSTGDQWQLDYFSVVYTEPNGTEHLLRDRIFHGNPISVCISGSGMGNVFEGTSDDFVTFVTDATLYSHCYPTSVCPSGSNHATGYLYFRNGTKSRVIDGRIQWLQDRNGNRIDYQYETGPYNFRLIKIIDSLGRETNIAYDVNEAPYGRCTRITFKGVGGDDKIIRISRETDLSQLLRMTQSYDSTAGTGGFEVDDPNDSILLDGGTVQSIDYVKAVWMPNGLKYEFKYNRIGQLARIDLPTGGAIEYDFADLFQMPFPAAPDDLGPLTNSISEKRVYNTNNVLLSRTKFTKPTSYTSYVNPTTRGETVRDVEVFDPSGNRLAKSRHYFFGRPDTRYPMTTPWWHGREFRTEQYDFNGTTPLHISDNDWRQRVPSWCATTWPCSSNPTEQAPTNNPFVLENKLTLADVNLVSKTSSLNPSNGTWSVDDYNNPTDIWQYDYGIGQPGSLLSHRQSTYLNYPTATNGIFLLGLEATRNVYGVVGGQETLEGATQITYDEYNQYPLLLYGSVGEWQDPGATRGNPTTTSRWLDVPSTWISVHVQYDQVGNAVNVWDAKGNLSQISYSSTYSYAYATQTTSAVPDPTGFFGSNFALVTSTTYDFYTGLITSSTDANNKTTTFEYNDPLNRQTQVNLPDGGRTRKIYVDAHVCGAYVETKTLLDSSGRETDAWVFADGLGRPYLAESYDGQDANNPYLRVDTQYDSMGRAYRVSSPYRTAGCTSTLNPSARWTTTTFDALSRPKTVITSVDNATVTTAYSGNIVTVTDPAGKTRRSVSDAQGRLTTVYEDPFGVNYATSYSYDALDRLRYVNQGGQQRYFMYDSLGRLIRAKNPEQDANPNLANYTDPVTANTQWSMGYGYDNNGNMTIRVDARNVTTTYDYDSLNRNKTVRYNDGTKDIDRHYDNPTSGKNGLGRFWYVNWDANNNARFDSFLAIDEYDALGRPKNYRQHFLINGVATPQFNVLRTYDYAGNVITQTYPSGHTATYTYDNASRMNSFTGTLGDGVSRSYASNTFYSEFGGLTQEQFGTQTPLYDKRHYNARGQLYDQRLSTYSLTGNEFDWNRGCLAYYFSNNYTWGASGADNNGDLLAQQHWAPEDAQYSNYAFATDYYAYDSLNRLSYDNAYSYSTHSGATTNDYQQVYTYDRWGNRTVSSATWGNVPKPTYTVNTANNRLVAPAGYSYGYDAAGNQNYDNYTGEGTRTYDAENHMKTAWANNQGQTYTYDFNGRRIKRVVNGTETWQIYGMDGELLAEYKAGAAAFLPTKEYGYRGGELLVTMSSGDDTRLSRFVTNLYYGALQRDPTSTELQNGINSLASAGATGGYSQLLTAVSQLARSLFTSTNYEYNTGRSDSQYTADLYYAYLQRGPDDGGLGWWVSQIPGSGRANVCNAFEGSSEFQTLVSTLYGSASSDNQRAEDFVTKAYRGALGRDPNSTELQTNRDALNSAVAQGVAAVQGQAETFVRGLVNAQVNDYSISDQQFVTNLYEAFLQRGPDTGGLNFWTSIASGGSSNRQNVLNAFATCGGFRELSATLYREAFWLLNDRLGTPRMIVDKSGSLASVRRHDYLPFGEELYQGIGQLRTYQLGYTGDSTRQKFTQKERDNETGLDYFLARYYSSTQGRFTSPDEFTGGPDELYTFADDASNNPTFYANLGNPQSLNKYQYAFNNPLRYVDPDGHDPLDPPQNPSCGCPKAPPAPPITDILDWIADKTGITKLADLIRVAAPAAAKAVLDNGGASAMRQDMDDLRMMRNGIKSGNSQQGQQSQQGQSNTASPNPNDNDKRPRSEGPVFKTNAEAAKQAKELGFTKIGERVHGQAVFKKGNQYITRDVDGHSGGAWKVANSMKDLRTKSGRLGTYDKDLNKIAN